VFTIGDFSKITGLTVKTLRFYHEQGLLEPSAVDAETGYRYYDRSKIEAARVITCLRSLDFTLEEIREIYHKGPGMIFRGNPKRYLTEIQMLVKDVANAEGTSRKSE
jgi:DNA-binding transcriptional MerR regulator